MINIGIVPNEYLYSSYVYALCQTQRLNEAVQVANQVIFQMKTMILDVSAFGALIKGFGDILHPKVGLSILAIMYRHGIHHDFIIFDNIIESFTHRPSNLNRAIQIFNFLPCFGYLPTVITHTILIHGLCHAKRFKEANTLFVSMSKSGIQPTAVTYTALVKGKGAFMSDMVSKAVSLIDEMNRKNMLYENDKLDHFFKVVLFKNLGVGFKNDIAEFDCFSYSIIVDQLCKAGLFREAKCAFQ